jgi:hypothetical protein
MSIEKIPQCGRFSGGGLHLSAIKGKILLPLAPFFSMFLEVVSKPPLGLNLCVGLRRSILEIFPIWMLVPIFLIGAVGYHGLPFYPAGF